jgi:hypothetical protein
MLWCSLASTKASLGRLRAERLVGRVCALFPAAASGQRLLVRQRQPALTGAADRVRGTELGTAVASLPSGLPAMVCEAVARLESRTRGVIGERGIVGVACDSLKEWQA